MRAALTALLACLALLAGCQPEGGEPVSPDAADAAFDRAIESIPPEAFGPPPPLLSEPGQVTEGSLRAQGEGGVVECPLKHTDVQVRITGLVTRVRLTQTFRNPFPKPIEAVYVFPLPATAAVDEMVMEVYGRRIVGVIKKREEAEQIYKEAVAKGQTASLLSQERPNIFTQSVGNIPPLQEVKIEIAYVDVLKADAGAYEFRFPMVVGPRYVPGAPVSKTPEVAADLKGKVGETPPQEVGKSEPAGAGTSPDTDRVPDASRITPPVLKPEFRNGHDVSLSVALDAGLPIRELSTPTHEVETVRSGLSRAEVRIKDSDSIPNRDFVLRWVLLGEKPQATVLSQPSPGGGGTFLVLLQPGLERELGEAPPRDLCFLVDVSGSMQGAPIAKSKEAMKLLLAKMRPQDRMQLVLFASASRKVFETYVPASPENAEAAAKAVDGQQGGGGTNMLEGVRLALADPDPGRMRIVLMLTDGFIGNESEIVAEAGNRCGDAVRFWVIGIGNSVNQHLVDGVAGVAGGMGEIQSLREDAAPLVDKVLNRLRRAQLSGVSLDWGGLAVREAVPQRVPDLWADQPVLILGRYGKAGVGALTLRGTAEGRAVTLQAQVCFSDAEQGNDSLANVWARRKIEALGREYDKARGNAEAQEELKAEITRLGLEHRLVTEYTSFVAVEETVAPGADGKPERKVVPVPLPEGTSFEGVFGDKPFQGKYWNSAIGIGGGAGGTLGGRFGGKRTLRAYGGGRATESSVMMGLIWLKNHQNPDGFWSSAKFPANCKKGICAGAGSGSDFETSALSLLAFLGAGHTHKHGKFKNTVKDALKAFKDKQNPDGSFGGEGGTAQDLRAHAVCALAMAEAYALTGQSALLVNLAQKAVDYLVSVQAPGSGFASRKGGAPDTVTTGWAVLALKSAKISGLNVPRETFDGALKWFDAMTDAADYGAAFSAAGDKGADKDFVGANPLTSTAAATVGRIFVLGNASANRPEVLGGGNRLKTSPPKWNLAEKTVDEEYWYFGTLAMFQMGRDYWKSWNEPMKNAIVPTQRRENCENGSWDPIGPRAAKMGRVWSTAIHTLSLEIYYRYGRVLNVKDAAPPAPPAAEGKAETPPEKTPEPAESKGDGKK